MCGMLKISGIYKIQSKCKPERCYIGSAVNIHNRWRMHTWTLEKNRHDNQRLQNHYNKYGIGDLEFSVLLGCDKEDLIKNEQCFLDMCKPYFNICKVAGSPLGYKHSKKAKLKMSKPRSKEARKNMSEAMMGNTNALGTKHSNETKIKFSKSKMGSKNPNYGKHLSDKTKDKMRKTSSLNRSKVAN